MPQKLIRLTCETNDGVFNSLFNEDIRIKENSEICLQSLSLERDSTEITIGGDNNLIEFNNVKPDFGIKSTLVPSGVFNRVNNSQLLDNITHSMNRVASMARASTEMNVSWSARENQNNTVTIGASVSPFYPVNFWNGTAGVNNTDFVYKTPETNIIFSAEPVTIVEDDLLYAIKVHQPAVANTSFIAVKAGQSASFVNTTAYPVYFGAGPLEERDILEIHLSGGEIGGKHYVNGVGSNTFDKITANSAENLYWCIFYISGEDGGGEQTCITDFVQVSLDSVTTQTFTDVLDGNKINSKTLGVSTVAGPIAFIPPEEETGSLYPTLKLAPELFKYLGFGSIPALTRNDTDMYEVVYNTLGGGTQPTYDFIERYEWEAPKTFDVAGNADTYLIESQSFTLDSYDSYGLVSNDRKANSGGSRRNILATIPVAEVPIPNENNGIIQYEPSTLYYIAIKNRGDIITRQLRFRLLDSQYEDIITQGMAEMVILIKEPY